MFLKRRLTVSNGTVAGQTYQIEYVITFGSNAPSGCAGVGGAPGEGVALLTGASSIEPIAVLRPDGFLRLNVTKTIDWRAGDIANGIPCEQALPNPSICFISTLASAHHHI
jgi:hypothetical protein